MPLGNTGSATETLTHSPRPKGTGTYHSWSVPLQEFKEVTPKRSGPPLLKLVKHQDLQRHASINRVQLGNSCFFPREECAFRRTLTGQLYFGFSNLSPDLISVAGIGQRIALSVSESHWDDGHGKTQCFILTIL